MGIKAVPLEKDLRVAGIHGSLSSYSSSDKMGFFCDFFFLQILCALQFPAVLCNAIQWGGDTEGISWHHRRHEGVLLPCCLECNEWVAKELSGTAETNPHQCRIRKRQWEAPMTRSCQPTINDQEEGDFPFTSQQGS